METAGVRSDRPFDRESCRSFLAGMEAHERYNLCLDLAFERMERKTGYLQRLFESTGRDWQQTAYLLMLQTVGDRSNRENYLEIGRQATYERVRREGPSVTAVEAMLFGTAGLLDGCRDDAYSSELRETFAHLRHKYGIRPLDPGCWNFRNVRPASHPRLRLAQLAVILSRTTHLCDTLLNCRDFDDAKRIFCADASQYWSDYYNPSNAADHTTKRLGKQRAQLVAINLVSVLQILYGNIHGKPELRQRAVELWEALPPEENKPLKFWIKGGIGMTNALETQAFIQLTDEHCQKGDCTRCRLAILRRAGEQAAK